ADRAPHRLWCGLECGGASLLVPGRVWCRVECGGASLLVPPRVWRRIASGPHRVWSWRGYLALQSPRTPHSMCPAAVGPRRGGATPRWGHAAAGLATPQWGHVAAGLATSRRAGAGLTAPGRAGAQPAWLRSGRGTAGLATAGLATVGPARLVRDGLTAPLRAAQRSAGALRCSPPGACDPPAGEKPCQAASREPVTAATRILRSEARSPAIMPRRSSSTGA